MLTVSLQALTLWIMFFIIIIVVGGVVVKLLYLCFSIFSKSSTHMVLVQ